MHMNSVSNIHQVAESFAKIFAKARGVRIADLTDRTHLVPAEVLRRARVRLDSVCMVLSREVWSPMYKLANAGAPNLFLLTDTSPPNELGGDACEQHGCLQRWPFDPPHVAHRVVG